MNGFALTRKELAVSAMVYLAVLLLTGEMYWGSEAAFFFGTLWVVQAVVHLWNTARVVTSGLE